MHGIQPVLLVVMLLGGVVPTLDTTPPVVASLAATAAPHITAVPYPLRQ